MLAASVMSAGTQAVLYLLAVVLLLVAAVLAFTAKAMWATLVAFALAVVYFIAMYNAFAVS